MRIPYTTRARADPTGDGRLQPDRVPVELTLLPRVAHRDRDVTGPRLRGLLALLAGDLRVGVSTTRLVDGLWPGGQPENPAKAVAILVSRARSQLGAELILTTPTGYRLSLAEHQVDAAAVLRYASDAVRCARAGDHAASLAAAAAGLALWDGTGDSFTDDPVSTLRAERRTAVATVRRARALALARLGRRAEAVEPTGQQHQGRIRGLAYRQEYYRGEAEDNGEVLSTAEMAEVPYGQFTGVLLTKDTITIEPTVQQFKMYAEGVGPVLVLGVSGGSVDREELLNIVQVPPGTGTGPSDRRSRRPVCRLHLVARRTI